MELNDPSDPFNPRNNLHNPNILAWEERQRRARSVRLLVMFLTMMLLMDGDPQQQERYRLQQQRKYGKNAAIPRQKMKKKEEPDWVKSIRGENWRQLMEEHPRTLELRNMQESKEKDVLQMTDDEMITYRYYYPRNLTGIYRGTWTRDDNLLSLLTSTDGGGDDDDDDDEGVGSKTLENTAMEFLQLKNESIGVFVLPPNILAKTPPPPEKEDLVEKKRALLKFTTASPSDSADGEDSKKSNNKEYAKADASSIGIQFSEEGKALLPPLKSSTGKIAMNLSVKPFPNFSGMSLVEGHIKLFEEGAGKYILMSYPPPYVHRQHQQSSMQGGYNHPPVRQVPPSTVQPLHGLTLRSRGIMINDIGRVSMVANVNEGRSVMLVKGAALDWEDDDDDDEEVEMKNDDDLGNNEEYDEEGKETDHDHNSASKEKAKEESREREMPEIKSPSMEIFNSGQKKKGRTMSNVSYNVTNEDAMTDRAIEINSFTDSSEDKIPSNISLVAKEGNTKIEVVIQRDSVNDSSENGNTNNEHTDHESEIKENAFYEIFQLVQNKKVDRVDAESAQKFVQGAREEKEEQEHEDFHRRMLQSYEEAFSKNDRQMRNSISDTIIGWYSLFREWILNSLDLPLDVRNQYHFNIPEEESDVDADTWESYLSNSREFNDPHPNRRLSHRGTTTNNYRKHDAKDATANVDTEVEDNVKGELSIEETENLILKQQMQLAPSDLLSVPWTTQYPNKSGITPNKNTSPITRNAKLPSPIHKSHQCEYEINFDIAPLLPHSPPQSKQRQNPNERTINAVWKMPPDELSQHEADQLVHQLSGTISSENCNFSASIFTTAMRVNWSRITTRAMNYSFTMMLICLTQIVLLLRQLLHSQTNSVATRVSIATVGWQCILDGVWCMVHILLCMMLQPLITAFAFVAFFKLILFCVIEMKYMQIIMNARNQTNGVELNQEGLRRQAAILQVRFYFALLVAMWTFYAFREHWEIFILALHSFWIPQILRNIYTEAKRPLHKNYLIGMSLTRLVAPIYVFGIGDTFLKEMNPMFPQRYGLCFGLIVWVGVQAGVLMMQAKYGARFMIPARLLPPKFDYSRPIPSSILPTPSPTLNNTNTDIELGPTTTNTTRNRINNRRSSPSCSNSSSHGSGSTNSPASSLPSSSSTEPPTLDCVICYSPIDVNYRRGYMLAPCDHIFHRECLEQWMDVKMECPICRTDLPPV
eukprot:CAMPEP_0195515190 /NCGR_PEP_ID=MMETSP0794_2-20130614/6347_1 /TAXON_ID=515487 /ORGANISM="Stephanopyxis turris, Strain CCMP 815" /LENGTH=1211 /DNA_ID=CAMNT_0040643581 /DNA_START=360 /DNA_END=3996 /DNA_ORIENTATION=+